MKNKALLTGLCILLAELLVAILLWLFGFRITYSPTLENSWDAISACAGWASVVVAGFAIYYASLVPKKIAEDQNRISLFEKRVDLYLTAQKLISCAQQIKYQNDCGTVLAAFVMAIGKQEDAESSNVISLLFELDRIERILLSGEFLFPHFSADQMTSAIIEARDLLIETDKCMKVYENSDDYDEDDNHSDDMDLTKKAKGYRDNYCKLCFSFLKEYASIMEEQLDLTANTLD